MGQTLINYQKFLEDFDCRLKEYFKRDSGFIHCKAGCSACCETGDYPVSQLELEYLMQGFASLDNTLKREVQENIKTIQRGGKCPFLIDKKCSIYAYRPIICRVHGLAYLCRQNTVKVPYCVNEGKNYSTVYNSGEITINPIPENLDTPNVLKEFKYGEIRNLFDWVNKYY